MSLPIGTSFRLTHDRTAAPGLPNWEPCTCRVGVLCPADRAYQRRYAERYPYVAAPRPVPLGEFYALFGLTTRLTPGVLPLTSAPAYLQDRLAQAEVQLAAARRDTPDLPRRIRYWREQVRKWQRLVESVEVAEHE